MPVSVDYLMELHAALKNSPNRHRYGRSIRRFAARRSVSPRLDAARLWYGNGWRVGRNGAYKLGRRRR
jgi:hypothetical protein